MMKKLIAAMLIATMILMGVSALAATKTYIDRDRDLTFEYDTDDFEIGYEDQTDDELMTILVAKHPEWGEVSIKFYLYDLEDGEKFPTKADFAELEAALGVTVEQGEWNGFKNVFMYNTESDGIQEYTFIAPIYDDDEPKVEDSLTVTVAVAALEDEEIAMTRDDAISAVLDSLRVLDD